MSTLTVRNIEPEIKDKLRLRAAAHGRSMEEEVRGTEQGISEAGGLETALYEILEQVNAVTMQMNQIATAAEEQTATTSEITNNIHHISEIIQKTSQSTNDATRAAVELSGKAEELTGLVQRFRL